MIADVLLRRILLTVSLLGLVGCNGPGRVPVSDDGELVEPPFEVRGEADGLLLVWFDETGIHTASRRSDIPTERREMVRVDDLNLAPDERLDPELVYVADLREAAEGDRYPVRRMPRAAFEARVEAVTAAPVPSAPAGQGAEGEVADADVIIYGASWCSACHQAAAFLTERHIAFVELDIERDPGARQAMLRAAQEAGVRTNGIPVIDFRGEIIAGFDRGALERAIERTRTPI